LIVISDGGDNASSHTLAEVLKKAEGSSAVVYTIGIFDTQDEDRNPDVLRRLARFTGGEAFFPAHLDDTVEICRRIAHDIRNQYTLGYVPTNSTRSTGLRALRVTASTPQGKLVVRTRSSYLAGPR
jgi:VWFA-related protein